MFKALKVITAGRIDTFYGPIAWNILDSILKGLPYGILYLALLELFAPIGDPSLATDYGHIAIYIIGMAVCLAVHLLVAAKASKDVFVNAYTISAKARIGIGEHLRKQSMGFFKDRDAGDVSALLLQDLEKVEQTFSHFLPSVISCIVLPAMVALFLLFADWRLACSIIVSVAIALPILKLSEWVIKTLGTKQMASATRVMSRTLEYVGGIKVIKAFNQTGQRFSRLENAFRTLKKENILLEAAPGPLVISYMLVMDLGFFVTLLLGTYFLMGGSLTVPVFLLFLVIGYQLYEPLKNLGLFLTEMRYMNIAADRITEVLETRPLPEPAGDVGPERHDVEFKDVRFRYRDADVLKGVSFLAPEKSITALVGPSGSGKTTITSLIARFWDVNSGTVLVGGKDVRDMKTDRLLACISVVFQEVYLFNDTVYNNIKLGKADATRDEVIAAAKAAQCHDFIEKLPKGYDTMVGEGGSTLSGGEKQRISIARALLKDAPIVLLDEATASLDPENELLIQAAIRELVKSKTVIVIAHRLYTVSRADQILVIDDGRIVERGRHEALIEAGGLYRRMWDEQQKAHGWKIGKATAVPVMAATRPSSQA